MRKIIFLLLTSTVFVFANAQEAAKETKPAKPLLPYVGFTVGGCVANPFSLLAGVQQSFKKHLVLAYDVHYLNTKYECNCDEVYSKGRFSSITPSVKLQYYSGKQQGRGFIAGVGLGYMFAKDRGTEQHYSIDPTTEVKTPAGEIVPGNWDFNSIAPSFTIGGGFRLFKLPAYLGETLYFAKTTEGWGAVTGGIEFHIGLRKISK